MKKTAGILSLFALFLLTPSAAYASSATYVVVQGDNLTKIAKRYQTTARAIIEANNLPSDRIYIGQTLHINQTEGSASHLPGKPVPAVAPQVSTSTPPSDIPVTADTSSQSQTAFVNVPVLNVRAQPSLDAEILSKLSQGTAVHVTEKGAEWSKINLNGREAYVASAYITYSQTPPAPAKNITFLPADELSATLYEKIQPLLHTPYVYGGTTTVGFDCSGFTSYVMQQYGVTLPRTSEEQFKTGEEVPFEQILPGDLLFYDSLKKGKVSHVAMYLGNGTIVHANGDDVRLEKVENMHKIYPFYGAKRYLQTSP